MVMGIVFNVECVCGGVWVDSMDDHVNRNLNRYNYFLKVISLESRYDYEFNEGSHLLIGKLSEKIFNI